MNASTTLSSLLHATDLQYHCFQLPVSLLEVATPVVSDWVPYIPTTVNSVCFSPQCGISVAAAEILGEDARLWAGMEQLRHGHMLLCHPCRGEGEVRKSNAGISNAIYHGRKIHQGSSVGS